MATSNSHEGIFANLTYYISWSSKVSNINLAIKQSSLNPSQRLQNPLIEEYTLNYNRNPHKI